MLDIKTWNYFTKFRIKYESYFKIFNYTSLSFNILFFILLKTFIYNNFDQNYY